MIATASGAMLAGGGGGAESDLVRARRVRRAARRRHVRRVRTWRAARRLRARWRRFPRRVRRGGDGAGIARGRCAGVPGVSRDGGPGRHAQESRRGSRCRGLRLARPLDRSEPKLLARLTELFEKGLGPRAAHAPSRSRRATARSTRSIASEAPRVARPRGFLPLTCLRSPRTCSSRRAKRPTQGTPTGRQAVAPPVASIPRPPTTETSLGYAWDWPWSDRTRGFSASNRPCGSRVASRGWSRRPPASGGSRGCDSRSPDLLVSIKDEKPELSVHLVIQEALATGMG
jgi:hypothetical protein